MSKKLSIIFGLFITWAISAQEITNAEKSNYKFKKIYHHDATPVQSQGNTGTCWSFSALSFFESEMIRLGVKNPPVLSEMYIVRKAYEMKAEKYIRMDGKTNFAEGGAFHDIPLVIKKYGIVPFDLYDGLNGQKSYNHSVMFQELNENVKKTMSSVGEPEGIQLNWKNEFSAILDKNLGKNPSQFDWNGKKFTPTSFAESLKLNMNDYYSLTSFTNHDMYAKCQLEIQDNWAWGDSYNVNLTDLVQTVKYALEKGFTVAWGADVSEKGFSFKNGIAVVPENSASIEVKGSDNKNYSDAGADRVSNAFLNPTKEMKITAEVRQMGYDNKTTTDDHGMHIVGLYQDQNGIDYFLVKNSWGTSNYPKGYLYVSEAYFKHKTINIFLHKDAIPQEIKANFSAGTFN
ncbi:MAG: C1 family peptidase [Bacteroidota bacterium]